MPHFVFAQMVISNKINLKFVLNVVINAELVQMFSKIAWHVMEIDNNHHLVFVQMVNLMMDYPITAQVNYKYFQILACNFRC
jgi:hypothetical protein